MSDDRAARLNALLAEEMADSVALEEALRALCGAVWNYDNNSHDIVSTARRAEHLLDSIAARRALAEYAADGGTSLDKIKTELRIE